jgi:hypothetical protein
MADRDAISHTRFESWNHCAIECLDLLSIFERSTVLNVMTTDRTPCQPQQHRKRCCRLPTGYFSCTVFRKLQRLWGCLATTQSCVHPFLCRHAPLPREFRGASAFTQLGQSCQSMNKRTISNACVLSAVKYSQHTPQRPAMHRLVPRIITQCPTDFMTAVPF